jgi:hypothetical protein
MNRSTGCADDDWIILVQAMSKDFSMTLLHLVGVLVLLDEKCIQYYIFWLENLKGSDHLEDLGLHGKIMLEWIYGK